jgi:hypothetical protein
VITLLENPAEVGTGLRPDYPTGSGGDALVLASPHGAVVRLFLFFFIKTKRTIYLGNQRPLSLLQSHDAASFATHQ